MYCIYTHMDLSSLDRPLEARALLNDQASNKHWVESSGQLGSNLAMVPTVRFSRPQSQQKAVMFDPPKP